MLNIAKVQTLFIFIGKFYDIETRIILLCLCLMILHHWSFPKLQKIIGYKISE